MSVLELPGSHQVSTDLRVSVRKLLQQFDIAVTPKCVIADSLPGHRTDQLGVSHVVQAEY